MTKYIKREMPDLNGEGATRAYYMVQALRNLDNEEFIERCIHHGGWQRGTVAGVLALVSDELARQIAGGYTVTIDGLGTFGAKLGVRKDKERDSFEEDEEKRNARSLKVSGLSFRADRRLVKEIDRMCVLERGGELRLHKQKNTKEERAAMAVQYLQEHEVMRVADYVQLTGLPYSTATKELRELAANPESGIDHHGRGPTKVYVKRDEG